MTIVWIFICYVLGFCIGAWALPSIWEWLKKRRK